MTTDSKWHTWYVDSLVQQWVATPSSNKGALIKARDETTSNQLSVFPSTELASQPGLRPPPPVTYLEQPAEGTSYAPTTAERSVAGGNRTVATIVSTTTGGLRQPTATTRKSTGK